MTEKCSKCGGDHSPGWVERLIAEQIEKDAKVLHRYIDEQYVKMITDEELDELAKVLPVSTREELLDWLEGDTGD